jgi:Putative prokaryotic signal transducing protein
MSPSDKSETFVQVVTATSLVEADLWKAVLEASGIPVYFRQEAIGAVLGNTVGELAAVDLWVPRDQAAEALRILQDQRVEPADEDEPV